jgi:hypothetical protein
VQACASRGKVLLQANYNAIVDAAHTYQVIASGSDEHPSVIDRVKMLSQCGFVDRAFEAVTSNNCGDMRSDTWDLFVAGVLAGFGLTFASLFFCCCFGCAASALACALPPLVCVVPASLLWFHLHSNLRVHLRIKTQTPCTCRGDIACQGRSERCAPCRRIRRPRKAPEADSSPLGKPLHADSPSGLIATLEAHSSPLAAGQQPAPAHSNYHTQSPPQPYMQQGQQPVGQVPYGPPGRVGGGGNYPNPYPTPAGAYPNVYPPIGGPGRYPNAHV